MHKWSSMILVVLFFLDLWCRYASQRFNIGRRDSAVCGGHHKISLRVVSPSCFSILFFSSMFFILPFFCFFWLCFSSQLFYIRYLDGVLLHSAWSRIKRGPGMLARGLVRLDDRLPLLVCSWCLPLSGMPRNNCAHQCRAYVLAWLIAEVLELFHAVVTLIALRCYYYIGTHVCARKYTGCIKSCSPIVDNRWIIGFRRKNVFVTFRFDALLMRYSFNRLGQSGAMWKEVGGFIVKRYDSSLAASASASSQGFVHRSGRCYWWFDTSLIMRDK